MSGVMYLMDEVSLDGPGSFTKLELLRKIYMETNVPICICGVPRLYQMWDDPRLYRQWVTDCYLWLVSIPHLIYIRKDAQGFG